MFGVVVYALVIPSVVSILDSHFLDFLKKHYGEVHAEKMNRADLGPNGDGSFGGGDVPRTRRPVVFIHGLRNRAGYLWRNRDILGRNGWEAHHVLATSWGDGDQGLGEAFGESLKCEHVKQVRNFLVATMRYYRSDIDVMAYSMGSPITRKAIMGGRCIDTGEFVGRPLTKRIHTFVSIAGANYGAQMCDFSFPGLCGIETGLHCASRFLSDINSKEGYEGRHRYYIHSTGDEIVGTWTSCQEIPSSLRGAKEIKLEKVSHDDTMFHALPEQLHTMQLQYRKDFKN